MKGKHVHLHGQYPLPIANFVMTLVVCTGSLWGKVGISGTANPHQSPRLKSHGPAFAPSMCKSSYMNEWLLGYISGSQDYQGILEKDVTQ